MWVQPGGSSDNQTLALGPRGRDNILNFAARSGASVYATCAGYYYSAGAEPRRRCRCFAMTISSTLAGSYWWFDKFYPSAWMMHLWPTVEGPISPIAVCAARQTKREKGFQKTGPLLLFASPSFPPLAATPPSPPPPCQTTSPRCTAAPFLHCIFVTFEQVLGWPSARFEQDNSRHPQWRQSPRLLRTRRPAPRHYSRSYSVSTPPPQRCLHGGV